MEKRGKDENRISDGMRGDEQEVEGNGNKVQVKDKFYFICPIS